MASEPSTPKPATVGQGKILATVLIYATFSAAWILLSDRLVKILVNEPGQIIQVSMFKGWFYVIFTSLSLYWGLKRWFYAPHERPQADQTACRQLLIPMLVLATVIIVFTLAGIAMNFKQHQDEVVTNLQAVANLKTRQIADWLRERQGDAEFVQSSVFFAEHYRQWQQDGDQASGQKLQRRLQQLCKSWNLDGVSIIDIHGLPIWHSDNAPDPLQPETLKTAGLAKEDSQIHLVGPYRDTSNRVLLDFVAPLTAFDNTLLVPVIVMHIDLARWLFANLDTLPIIGASGESLLLRRDGDRVQYLTDLKHSPDSAVKLHVPLSTSNLLAAQLLLGKVQLGSRIEGVDYRNIPALGVANNVEGTDWYLLTQLDQSEIDAQAMDNAVWVALVGILALFVVGAGFHLLRQMQQLNLVQAVQKTQAERLRALNLLAAIADSSDDAIYAKDPEGRYILFNRAASVFTGKTVEEVLGHDDTVLFPKEQAANLLATGQQVMTEGHIISFEETLSTVAGERVFHTTKGPLYDDRGNVIGIFGISRDITTLKSIVAALSRQSEELLEHNRELERFNSAMVGREIEMIKLKDQVNALSLALGQAPPYNLKFVDEHNLPNADGSL